MFCAGAANYMLGDSSYIGSAIMGLEHKAATFRDHRYFRNEDMDNPKIFPAQSSNILKYFPPSILITGTRDYAMSSVLATHKQLTKLGVKAELHVWDGLEHGFHLNPFLPESKEAYHVIVNFFDEYLGIK